MTTKAQITFAANQGDIGGGEVMLLHLAHAARDLGVAVDVVGPTASGVVEAASKAGFPVHELGATRRAYLIALRRWRGRGDLLWANGLAPAFATSGQRNRVVHLHQEPLGKQATAARAARVGARITLVPSRFMAGRIAGSRTLANWTADVPSADSRPDNIVGFIGRPSADKGVVVLADAIHLLAQRRSEPPRLLIAGESRFVADDERRSVDASLSRVDQLLDRVGWVTPQAFFSSITLAAFPSTWQEPFGLVAAEAMSARVPFVISDAGALPEVAGPSHPWIAPAGDAVRLADQIEAALDATATGREAAVADARTRWEEHFSPEAGRKRLAALLGDLNVR